MYARDRAVVLKVKDVAEMLAVSVRKVWRLSQEEGFPKPVKLGGSSRWVESDVLAYIERLRGRQAKA